MNGEISFMANESKKKNRYLGRMYIFVITLLVKIFHFYPCILISNKRFQRSTILLFKINLR